MEPDDRYRMLRDESRWNPIRLRPRSQPELSRQRGGWGVRALQVAAALVAIALLGTVGVWGLRNVHGSGGHAGPAVGPAATGSARPDGDDATPTGHPRCPAWSQKPPTSDGIPGVRDELLPIVPVQVLVCSYGWGVPSGGGLGVIRASVTTDPAALAAARTALNAAPKPSRQLACPDDAAPVVRLTFTDAAGVAVAVDLVRSGCGTATNGPSGIRIVGRTNDDSPVYRLVDGFHEPSQCPSFGPSFGDGRAVKESAEASDLVPFVPEGALICGYEGHDAGLRVPVVDEHRIANAASLTALADALNGQSQDKPTDCVADDPGKSLGVLLWGAGKLVSIVIWPGSCGWSTNEPYLFFALGNPLPRQSRTLSPQLDALLRSPELGDPLGAIGAK